MLASGDADFLCCLCKEKMMRTFIAGCLLLLVAACSVTEQAKPSQVQFSGFLGDYTALTPTDNSNQVLLRYIDPNAPWSTYTAVRFEPVTFWAGSDSKIPLSTQQTLTDYAYQKFMAALTAKGIRLTDQAGPGVLTVRMALTDASSATPVLRTISVVVPQARLLSAASSLVTGQYAFTGSIQSEGDAVDASGKRVGAWVDKRFGGTSIKNGQIWPLHALSTFGKERQARPSTESSVTPPAPRSESSVEQPDRGCFVPGDYLFGSE
jgi:hypothetical protein